MIGLLVRLLRGQLRPLHLRRNRFTCDTRGKVAGSNGIKSRDRAQSIERRAGSCLWERTLQWPVGSCRYYVQ